MVQQSTQNKTSKPSLRQVSNARPVSGMAESDALRVVDLLPEHRPHLRALAAKYPQMDFCDTAVVRLAEIFPRATVITTDSAHFTVFRRFRDKPLALIHPSSR